MAGSFKVNGKDYNLVNDPDVGEMCDMEREFGVEFGSQRSGVRTAAALMWISIRRVDPSVDVEDIRRLPLSVFEGIHEDVADPPTLTPESNGSSGEPLNVSSDALA